MASGLPLSLILDRPIAFHAALARVAGGVKAGLVLGQAIYWQNRCRSGDGWWWKTQKQWTDETGLSRWEMELARKALVQAGLIQSRIKGVPARRWFRINIETVERELETLLPADAKEGMGMLLKRPVAFHRALVEITGSVKAAIVLGQALYWSERGTDDGWWWKTQKQWEEETGMSRREMETARRILGELGLIEERRERMPSRVWYRVDGEELRRRLAEIAERESDETREKSPVCGKPPLGEDEDLSKRAKNRQFAENRHSVCGKPPLQYTYTTAYISEYRKRGNAESAPDAVQRPGEGVAPGRAGRSVFESEFGLACPDWLFRKLPENRACRIAKANRLDPPGVRRVLCEFAARLLADGVNDPEAYFAALCRAQAGGELKTSAPGEEALADIRFL